MTRPDLLRYSRHLALPQVGEKGQERLAAATVLVVGLGGLGSVASLYLATGGVGHILLNDFDRVDLTNLPRQILFRDGDVGTYKTTATATQLRAANPGIRISELNRQLNTTELSAAASACSLLVDCSDNFATRLQINRVCVSLNKPLVTGAALRFQGQVGVFLNQGKAGACYRCWYTEENENLETCAGQGILAPVAGTIGALVATESLKVLLAISSGLQNHLWLYDGLTGASHTVSVLKVPDCPACGVINKK